MRMIIAALALFSSIVYAAAPQSGLWWSPSESGRGYALDAQGGTLVVTTFAYGPDGRMQWYYSDGPLQSGGSFWSGTLLRLDFGQPLSGGYVPATIIGNGGTISISFSSRSTGTLTLPGGRQVAIQRQNFGVGTPPNSLLGSWIYAYCISDGAVCFMERYEYTTLASATSTGNGVVGDLARRGAAEYQLSGSFAGRVIAFRFNSTGGVLDQYLYSQYLEEGRGFWVSPTTFNQYGMNAYRFSSPSGIDKRFEVGETDEAREGKGRSGEPKAITLEELAAINPELGRIAREMWGKLQ